MTVATVLLQATSLISTLSQFRTNGEHSLFISSHPRTIGFTGALCLPRSFLGGSNLGTFAASKPPQFLENK